MARSLRDRLEFDLTRNRAELLQVVDSLQDLNYAPSTGMKSYRAQLMEIGAMEAESLLFLKTGQAPDWSECEAQVKGASLPEILESMATVRANLLSYLASITDEQLSETLRVPTEWESFVGDSMLEREELFRWLARHEYYHLGQIVAYRWIQGFNPYKRSDS